MPNKQWVPSLIHTNSKQEVLIHLPSSDVRALDRLDGGFLQNLIRALESSVVPSGSVAVVSWVEDDDWTGFHVRLPVRIARAVERNGPSWVCQSVSAYLRATNEKKQSAKAQAESVETMLRW